MDRHSGLTSAAFLRQNCQGAHRSLLLLCRKKRQLTCYVKSTAKICAGTGSFGRAFRPFCRPMAGRKVLAPASRGPIVPGSHNHRDPCNTGRPSTSRNTRSMCRASSMLWVAIRAATPCERQSSCRSLEHRRRGRWIEVAGRLVGQRSAGLIGQGPGDGHPLLLAAGELRRLVVQAARPDPAGPAGPPPAPAPARGSCRRSLRQGDVVQGREFRQQMVELIDEADRSRRSRVRAASFSLAQSSPPTTIWPAFGSLQQARRRAAGLDLPEPDGPISPPARPDRPPDRRRLQHLQRRRRPMR